MNISKNIRCIAVCAAAAALLVGCATPAKVALSDSTYMAENFTPAQLSAGVREKLTGAPVTQRFRTLHLDVVIATDEAGRQSEITAKTDYTAVGNGYVQQRTEFSRNAVPYRTNLALSFAGLYTLKLQTVFLSNTNAQIPFEVKNVAQADLSITRPQAGRTYVFERASGMGTQIANFQTFTQTCVTGNTVGAASISSSLAGSATMLECTLVGPNQTVTSRETLAWLSDYGLAIVTHAADARVTQDIKVVAAQVS